VKGHADTFLRDSDLSIDYASCQTKLNVSLSSMFQSFQESIDYGWCLQYLFQDCLMYNMDQHYVT
jgi:hypothetical protein